jgi:phosphopantothenoylcysteine decarboxylase
MKVLIGCTGSVAAIKVNELVDQLKKSNFEVQVIATECARHFLSKQIINCKVWVDEDEWNMWNKRGDPVLHIDLRKWADILVLAPLDANSLAKIAHVSYFLKNCAFNNLLNNTLYYII